MQKFLIRRFQVKVQVFLQQWSVLETSFIDGWARSMMTVEMFFPTQQNVTFIYPYFWKVRKNNFLRTSFYTKVIAKCMRQFRVFKPIQSPKI